MSNALERQPHDVGVHSIPASRISDPRVRLAEEDWLQSQVTTWQAVLGREPQWADTVELSNEQRTLTVKGEWHSAIYPQRVLPIDSSIELPPLEASGSVVSREDYLYLVVFVAVSGQEHDAALGEVSYEVMDADRALRPVQKENALRDRAYYVLLLSQNELSAQDFYGQLAQLPYRNMPAVGTLQIPALEPEGWNLGSWKVFPVDPALQAQDYPVLQDFVEIAEIGRVRRQQNWMNRGFTWGLNGEGELLADYHLKPTGMPIPRDLSVALLQRLLAIAGGNAPVYSRTVQNLIAGLVGGNPGRQGEGAASPNGSAVIGSDDRITFSNQAVLQHLGVQIVTATTDGQGNAVVTAQLPTDAPVGSTFSERRTDHRIYTADATEESNFGQFLNLGGTGSLVWTSTPNSSIAPGQKVYFVPGIQWSGGSGLGIPFSEVEQVWRNTVPIDPANILSGADGEDLSAYQAPVGDEEFFVVTGRERAAVHYLYHRVNVVADAQGVAVIPDDERGCFAFIEGVPGPIEGRFDSPVVNGLTPNASYSALVYYPPRRNEQWQLQIKYPEYQGLGSSWMLDEARVVSEPVVFVHTHGGGNSVFRGDQAIQFSPISMHLPAINSSVKSYDFDTSIRLAGEPAGKVQTWRQITPISAGGLALPHPGMLLSFVAESGADVVRAIAGRLEVDGAMLGFRCPTLYQKVPFQTVLAFVVEKMGKFYCVVATRNGTGGEDAPLSIEQGTAFDIFML